jgi:intracellular multiplication protein IcmE
MAGMVKNLAKNFSDSKVRTIFIVTGIIFLFGAIIAYFQFRAHLTGGTPNAAVGGAPTLQSVPGGFERQETIEYSRLQEQANASQAQQAEKEGSSSIPTIIRSSRFGQNEAPISGPGAGENWQEGLGFSSLGRVQGDQGGVGGAGGAGGAAGAGGAGANGANGLGANGIGLNGQGANGLGANGLGANGASGTGANGLGANGMGLNGQGANGLGANGLGGANGMGANGLGANGAGANGLGANGTGANGLGTNGMGLNGQGANGMGANGLGANGMGLNGQGANGMGANGMGMIGLNGQGANGLGANGLGGANGMGANGLGANGLGGANGMGANGLGGAGGGPGSLPSGFSNPNDEALQNLARRQAAQMSAQQLAAMKQQIQSAMTTQTTQLVSGWNAPTQQYVAANASKENGGEATGAGGIGGLTSGLGGSSAANAALSRPPLMKAGTIMFAVLDTAINSDEPGPVLATIVDGRFKDSRLIGTLTNQGQKVMLNFTTMVVPSFPKSLSVNAVAIDTTTARTALSSDTNNHYVLRYGSLFASAFLQGYGQTLLSAGSTVQSTGLQTVTTAPMLSPTQEIYAALGTVGQKWGTVAGNIFNTPPTVQVYSGTSLGVLILSDVQQTG